MNDIERLDRYTRYEWGSGYKANILLSASKVCTKSGGVVDVG